MIHSLRIAGLLIVAGLIAATSPALGEHSRPFRSRVTATWDNVYAALPPELGGAGLAHFSGGGPTTHMGKTTQQGTLSLGLPVAPDVFPGSGTVTITGANGDSVSFDYVGFLNAGTGEGTGSFTFTGGTGRFADVTGGGTFVAAIDLANVAGGQAMTVVLDGTIDY
jgi:hypothetical protein